jgi:SAM-dependent methyltransferase
MKASQRIVRAPGAKAWAGRDAVTVLARDGRALRFEGASGELCLAVFEFLALPRTRDEVLARVESLTGSPLVSQTPLDDLLTALASLGATALWGDRTEPNDLAPVRVVLGVSGAIAAAFAPTLLTRMLAARWEVRLAATENALRFVSRAALEALAASPLAASHWARDDRTRAHHIELAEWAELMVVYPASATTLSRIARGDCDDVVSAAAIATRAPVVLAPSMNSAMYESPSVERNVRQLRDDGFHLIVPAAGVEVAHAPEARTPMIGPAPLPDEVFAVARAVLAQHRAAPFLPRDGAAWEALYRTSALAQLPWHREAPEDDLSLALRCLTAPDARALDLGTGAGTVARLLSSLGARVTATDLSATALDRGRARNPSIDWTLDDVTASALAGPFDLIADRGCLHCLPRAQHGVWRDLVARVAAPGARLVALVHDAREATAAGTHGYDEPSLRALLAPIADEVRVTASTMRGDRGPLRRAWLCTARLRAQGP